MLLTVLLQYLINFRWMLGALYEGVRELRSAQNTPNDLKAHTRIANGESLT